MRRLAKRRAAYFPAGEPAEVVRREVYRERSGRPAARFLKPEAHNRLMAVSMRCPRCKQDLTAADADTRADDMLTHLRDTHGHAPPREHVLARIERHSSQAYG
jgi:hypothetical protein